MNSRNIFSLVAIFFMVFLTHTTCYDANEAIGSGQVTGFSQCTDFKKTKSNDSVPRTRACIIYKYNDESESLVLEHINACFNCCSGKITAEVNVLDSEVTIIEKEQQEYACTCKCLMDTKIEIIDLPKGEYRIEVVEPYLNQNK